MKHFIRILSLLCTMMLLLGAVAEERATVTVDGVVEHVTVTLTMEDDRIKSVEASSDNTEADERGKEALSLIAEAMVENNTLNVDAISGATCTSNAVIAGAIEAWMQIMTERMIQEEWMETTNAEAMTGGWENVPHETAELPADAQAAFDKAVEGLVGAEYVPVALLSTQVVAGTNYCILCQITPVAPNATTTWAMLYIYADLDGNAEITNVYELYIDRHSTQAD
ncbi:MAG: FMN-binding protein [Clostridia bacterium]|nr:FMN-binding protein [Clostridia bacterium]